jgi:predicted permease
MMPYLLRLARARWRGLLRKSSVEREMEEELRFHVRMREEENVRRGMTPEEARREAARSFGNWARVREACRDVKGGGMVDTLIQDVTFGARMLRKNLGFTLVAVVTLALGIGANTAIFSVVNAVVFRALPYPHPERIVSAHWRWGRGESDSVSATEYAFWRERSRSFEEAAGVSSGGAGFNLTGGVEPQRVQGLRVTEGFFRVLGVQPALGRGFVPEEDRPQGPCAAVITDGLWRGAFGGDLSVVGRQVQLNGQACAVVGVMPAGFQYQTPVDVLTPSQLRVDPHDQGHNTEMIARLKPGVTIEQAQGEMDANLQPFREAYPNHAHNGERGIRLVPYREAIVGDVSGTLLILFGAVGFVLLIACANVANLLLARASSRGGEMAVRVALGAGRLRLVRQLMTENLLLSLLGGAAGLALALWGVPALLALSPAGLPRADEIRLDAHAMSFAALASCMTSVLFGVTPALQATRLDVNRSLKASAGRAGAGRVSRRVRSLLVVAEVALSLVLLVGAGLLVVSFGKLRGVSLGFDPENLTTLQVSLNSAKYRTTAQAWELQRRVAERIRALPGVTAVATIPSLPLERGLNMNPVVEGRGGKDSMSAEARAVSPDYFRAMGVPLREGRAFSDGDTAEAQPVAIVNEAFARRFWHDGEPVGQFLTLEDKEWQVVGVAADIKEMGLARGVKETFYVPTQQMPDGLTRMLNRGFLTSWLVRTSAPVELNAQLRAAIRETDAELPVARIRPMTAVVSSSIATQLFVTTLMTAFAGLALALTAVGLYGVLSYQVSTRTQEIGIRMALGAQARDVVRLVVGQGLRLTLVGVVLGLAGALALTRVISGLLFNVSATDPLTFAAVSLLLVAVALAACFIPARRATRVDPLDALRHE